MTANISSRPLPRAGIDHCLLIITRKDTLPVDLSTSLRKWIEICFGEAVAKELAPLCQVLHAARIRLLSADVTRATSAASTSDLSGIITNVQKIESDFAKYDALIDLLIGRLFLEGGATACSISNRTGDIYSLYPCVEFTWYNCFNARNSQGPVYQRSGSLLLEKFSARFNLACILVEQAAFLWRDPSKRARLEVLALQSKLYQKAAGLLDKIREEKARYASAAQSEHLHHAPLQSPGHTNAPGQQVTCTMDLSSDWLQRFSTLLLGQAQECFYCIGRTTLEQQRKEEGSSSSQISIVSLAAGAGSGSNSDAEQQDYLDADDHKELSAAAMQVSYFYKSVFSQNSGFAQQQQQQQATQGVPSAHYGVLLFEPQYVLMLPPIWQYHPRVLSSYFNSIALAHHAQYLGIIDQERFGMKVGCLAKATVLLDECIKSITTLSSNGIPPPQELVNFAKEKFDAIGLNLQHAMWCNAKVYHKAIPNKTAVDSEIIQAESNVSAAYTLHENIILEVNQELDQNMRLVDTVVSTISPSTNALPLLSGARERLEMHLTLLINKLQATSQQQHHQQAPSHSQQTLLQQQQQSPAATQNFSLPNNQHHHHHHQQQAIPPTNTLSSNQRVTTANRSNSQRPLLAEAFKGLESLSHYALNYKSVGYVVTGFANLKSDLDSCTFKPLLPSGTYETPGATKITSGPVSSSVIIGLNATSQLLSQGLIDPKHESVYGIQGLLAELVDEFEKIKKLVQAADDTVIEFLDNNHDTILCWTAFQQLALREAFPQTIFGKELFNFRSDPAFKRWQQSVDNIRNAMIQSERDMQDCARMYAVVGATQASDYRNAPVWLVNYSTLTKQYDLVRNDTTRILDLYRENKAEWERLHTFSIEDIEKNTLSVNERAWLSRIQQPNYCTSEERSSILSRGSLVHIIISALLVPRAMLQACILPIIKDTLKTYAHNILAKLQLLSAEELSNPNAKQTREVAIADQERNGIRGAIERLKLGVMNLQTAQQELFQSWYTESYGKTKLSDEASGRLLTATNGDNNNNNNSNNNLSVMNRTHRRLYAVLRYWSMILWVYESERALSYFSKQLQMVKACMNDAYTSADLENRLKMLRVQSGHSHTTLGQGPSGIPLPGLIPVYTQQQQMTQDTASTYVKPFTADDDMYNEN